MAATPATLTSYQAVMKEQYYPDMRSAVFTGAVLLDYVQKRSPGGNGSAGIKPGLRVRNVRLPRGRGFGKQITFDIHTEQNWGVGARAAHHGDATGYMPSPGSQSYVEGHLLAASYFGVAELDGALIDSTHGPDAAGLRALDSEMRPLPAQLRRQINIDCFGNGTGKLTDVTATSTGTTITVSSVVNFTVNQPIVVANADGTAGLARTIVGIDAANSQIEVDSATSVDNTKDIFRTGLHNTNVSSEYSNALSGLGQIISSTVDYAGLDRSEVEYAATRGGEYLAIAQANFTIDHLEDAVFDAPKRANGKPSLIICDHNFYKLYGNLYFGQGRWQVNQQKLKGGYPALMFHDVPLVRDHACPAWTAYILDMSTFELGIERELSLMNEDNVQMVRVFGTNGQGRDAYQFAFITRVNLLCNNPGANAIMTITPT